tara:strand:- start:180 stop:488 length:309 start_codon:yes stop_codon:yes gene_type:complete
MKNISNLTEALKVLNKHKKDNEVLLQEKIAEMRNVDLLAEAMQDEMVKDLVGRIDESEKDQFDKEMRDITHSYASILDHVADGLENPETREKIVEELLRRMS